MLRRPLWVLLEVCGVLLAGGVAAAALLAWRLASGPVDIDFLTPYLEDAFRDGPARLEIGGTALRWTGADRPLHLAALDVRLLGPDGQAVATLPELAVSLRGPDLLRGRLVPTRLDLVRPELRVIRTEEGRFSFGLGEDGTGDALAPLLEALARPPGTSSDPLARLTGFGVVDGRLTVEDRQLGLTWDVPDADIDLRRQAAGIAGTVGLAVVLGDQVMRQTAGLFHAYATGETDATLAFAGLVPAALAEQHRALAPLAALDSPLDGTVSLHLDAGFRPVRGSFDLRGGAGRIAAEEWFPEEPLPVAGLALSGAVDFPVRALTIDRAAIDLGGPRIEAFASLVETAGGIDLIGRATVTELPVDRLDRTWPHGVGAKPRRWVTRSVSEGTVRRAGVTVHARLPAAGDGVPELRSVAGEIAFDGVTIDYLEGMPPVTGVAGSATFDASRFDVRSTAGRLLDLDVPQASVAIYGFETPVETIEIEGVVAGPVRTVLEVIDSPRLRYARAVGIDPASAAGTMAGRLRFTFPLYNDLPLERVRLAAAANLRGAALGGIVGGMNATAIDAALDLDGRGMALRGTATLGRVPVAFDWSERFGRDRDYRTRLAVTGTLDEAARTAFAVPELPWLSGPVPVEAVFTAGHRRQQTVTARFDLEPAALRLDPIGWEKPAGVPGRADLTLDLVGGAPVRLPRVAVTAAGLRAVASIDLAPGGTAIRQVDLSDFAQGHNRFAARITRLEGDAGYAVEARGASLDLRRAVAEALDGGPEAAGAPPEPEPPARPGEAAAPPGPPLRVALGFGVVMLGDERALFNVEGNLARDGSAWREVDLSARAGETGTVRVQYRPSGDGGATLSVLARDAGAALHAFDLMPDIRGGTLSVQAARHGAADAPLTGSAELEDFRIVRAPILARLLAALSLGGLQDLLTTDGIGFSRLVGGFTLDDRVMTLRDAQMAGGALGLTGEGRIDLRQSRMDIAGMIVPVYGVNQVLGAIPLLGDLLTGGEGQGLIAFTYRARGPLGDPSVSVNPLSVLAPGILRNLFLATPGSDIPTPQTPAGDGEPSATGGGG